MSRFDIHDTVTLRQNRALVGVVEQTYNNPNSVDLLEDELFIGHASVPPEVLWEFSESWRPSRSYAVVRWRHENQGRSLVAETDLDLLDRSFLLGDSVRLEDEHGHRKVGIVTNILTRYILQSIWNPELSSNASASTLEDSDAFLTSLRSSPSQNDSSPLSEISSAVSAETEQAQLALLIDVSQSELISATDFEVDDYVVAYGWLGTVEDHDSMDVILLLPDGSVVAVAKYRELKIIIPDTGKPLVNVPHSHIRESQSRHGNEYSSVPEHDGLVSIHPRTYCRGQCVITSRRNLAKGRWIKGQYNPEMKPQGVILDVRSRSLSVRWLCPNPFASYAVGRSPPIHRHQHRPYDNLGTFRSTCSLRPNRRFRRYDHGNAPSTSPSSVNQNQEFRVGDHVRFRDLVAAGKQYWEDSHGHDTFSPISPDQTYGFDMNEFKILYGRQNVQVQWQDGTRTWERSVSLLPQMLPEFDLCPADVVLHKEGLSQAERGSSATELIPYNEMQYMTGDYDLLPKKVGIIQCVDSEERLARVRWFREPRIKIINHGQAVGTGALFGPLSETSEEISFYEVLTQPALDLKHGDLAVVVPQSVSPAIMRSIQDPPPLSGHSLPLELSLGITNFLFFDGLSSSQIFHSLRQIARAIFPTQRPLILSQSSHVDWIGEVIEKGTDGLITIRLGTLAQCQDVKIPFDQILTIIHRDIDFEDDFMSDDHFDSTSTSDSSIGSPIEESIEYDDDERGGHDSNEDLWLTDEESSKSSGSGDENDMDTGLLDADLPVPASPEARSQEEHDTAQRRVPSLGAASKPSQPVAQPHLLKDFAQATAEPESFAVLDVDPPNNHFYVKQHQTNAPTRLRRIQKEYKILSSSLPPGIFVRTYESRLDLLRVMIIGPLDTPYEFAPLVIDLHLHAEFPAKPPYARFHSWTHGLGRINPNLYEDGKICLSLLGTWEGKNPGENWSEGSTLLQILVSLTGLVLVKKPFYNEAGFDDLAAEGAYAVESLQYTEKAYVITRGFIQHALRHAVAGFEDVLSWTYLPVMNAQDESATVSQNRPNLLQNAISRAQLLMDSRGSTESHVLGQDLLDGRGQPNKDGFIRKLSKGATAMLRRYVEDLEKLLQEYAV